MFVPQQQLVSLGDLVGADYNPRSMPEAELRKLTASLKEFGFVQPVVARKEDGLIVGGHQRVTAMRVLLEEAGQTEAEIAQAQVPVVYIDGLDDAKTKMLNLALNKIHGEWDYQKLNELFASVPDTDPALLELSGFAAQEIADITGLMSAAVESTRTSVEDIDAALAAHARRLTFALETDQDLEIVTAALKACGMSGPGNAAEALVVLAKSKVGQA